LEAIAAYLRHGVSPPPPREGHTSSLNEMSDDDAEVLPDSDSKVMEMNLRQRMPSPDSK
jgi:hypothetical protein